MAEHKTKLDGGLKVGETIHKDVILREVTAEDVLSAQEESEKLVMVPGPDGAYPQFVQSPALMGINVLRRQIKKIGDIDGPLSRDMIGKLTPRDLDKLQREVDKMELAAASEAVARKGRLDNKGAAD